MGASTFRQTATSIDFYNVVIVGPRLHDYPCTVPFEGPNPVLVQYLARQVRSRVLLASCSAACRDDLDLAGKEELEWRSGRLSADLLVPILCGRWRAERGDPRWSFVEVEVGADGGGRLISGRCVARGAPGRLLRIVARLAQFVFNLVDGTSFVIRLRVEVAAARASLTARALGALAGLGLRRGGGVVAALLRLTRRCCWRRV